MKDYRARVTVMPREVVLDPQGKAIRDALDRLGFANVSDVRAGKSFAITISATTESAAKKAAAKMCETLLANLVVEDYSVEIEGEADPS